MADRFPNTEPPDINSEDEWGEDDAVFGEMNLFFEADSSSDPDSDDNDLNGENEQETDDGIRRWVRYPEGIDKTPEPEPFDEVEVGIDESVKCTSISEFFKVFLTIDILAAITNKTNEYAEKNRRENPEQHKGKWTPVSPTTMMKFISLTFLMGMITKPRLKDYWSTLDQIATPFFSKVMRRDTFLQILRYINFPHEDNNDSAMGKVNWLFAVFNTISKACYHPRRDICIDESMVPYKGRSKHIQYIPSKPHKWGLKVWVLAESMTGYICQAFPYYSRSHGIANRIYEDVCLRLLTAAQLAGKYHHMYFDNFFSSIRMFEDFASKYGTLCCGTIRKNRKGLPKGLMVKKHKDAQNRGDVIFSKSGNVMLSVWKDRKLIHVISTIHGSIMRSCVRTMRDEQGKFVKKEIGCPEMIRDYSKHMGGVDLADQHFHYYSFGRKSQKWTKKFLFYVFELMKINSYIMFNSVAEKKVNLYDFGLKLVKDLIDFSELLNPDPRTPACLNPSRLVTRCMPADREKRLVCKVCAARVKSGNQTKNPSQPRYGCTTCNVTLCLPECFTLYHTVEKFENIQCQEE